jgi:hypothetical protein
LSGLCAKDGEVYVWEVVNGAEKLTTSSDGRGGEEFVGGRDDEAEVVKGVDRKLENGMAVWRAHVGAGEGMRVIGSLRDGIA